MTTAKSHPFVLRQADTNVASMPPWSSAALICKCVRPTLSLPFELRRAQNARVIQHSALFSGVISLLLCRLSGISRKILRPSLCFTENFMLRVLPKTPFASRDDPLEFCFLLLHSEASRLVSVELEVWNHR